MVLRPGSAPIRRTLDGSSDEARRAGRDRNFLDDIQQPTLIQIDRIP